MRAKAIVGALVLFLAARFAAFAAEPWDPGGPLDTCLAAALKERPGIVTGWRQVGGGEQPPYEIHILNQQGKIGETTCDSSNPANFQFREKGGVYRYAMYERATVPEAKARASAPDIFAGPVRFLAMEVSVSLANKPYYRYQMFLPSGYKAIVEIDATVGRLLKAEVK